MRGMAACGLSLLLLLGGTAYTASGREPATGTVHSMAADSENQGQLTLRFVDENGAPLGGMMVQAQKDFYRPGYKEVPYDDISGFTDPDGRIAASSLAPGYYQVSAGWMAPEDPVFARFLLPYAGGSQGYTLPVRAAALKPETFKNAGEQRLRDIAIQVVDAAGSPVPDVVISAVPKEFDGRTVLPEAGARSDAPPQRPEPLRARKTGRDGVYRARALSNHIYTLTAQNNLLSPAYAQQHELSITAADGDWELPYTLVYTGEPPLETLSKISEKTVIYFRRPSGGAAAGLAVQVRDAASGRLVSDGWTDYEGKYLLLRADPAQYELTVADEAAGESARYRVDTTAGGDLRFDLTWALS